MLKQTKRILILLFATLFVFFSVEFFMIGWLQNKMTFFPSKALLETPQRYQLAFEDVWFETADREKIHGWYIPAKPVASMTLFYLHGNAGNMGDRAWLMELFSKLGVNLFMIDYRGYGKSSGQPSEVGLYRDAEAAYFELVKRRQIPAEKIILFGSSLGGAVAVEVAAKFPIGKLILESTFTSSREIAAILYPTLPLRFFMHDSFNSLTRVKALTMPKLVIHGKRDSIIPFHMGEKLFAALPPPKQFLPFEKADHNDIAIMYEQAYLEGLRKFLQD